MIQGMLALALLTACLAGTFWIVQRMVLTVLDAIREDRARRTFPWQRERLELRFIQAVARREPQQSRRWALARWNREVCWARDRTTRGLMVLVGVELPDDFAPNTPSRKIAVFEYRAGIWFADGIYIASPTPSAACKASRFDLIGPPGMPEEWA
ncbi:MAG: hypothetical protein U0800_25045 [Isosphaeraceae bacterium]